MKNEKVKESENSVKDFQEVEVRRLSTVRQGDKLVTKFERHKVLRPRVRIRQEQADLLNDSVRQCDSNMFFSMYLLPGEAVEDFVREVRN